MNSRVVVLWSLVAAAGLSSGCSFSREWDRANRLAPPSDDITGAWVGTWQNSNNDHTDRLKAVITRVSDTTYQARFKAWWHGILSGTFDAKLTGQWENGVFVFGGTQKVMGWEFMQKGHASPTHFTSEYSSSNDTGAFTMRRTERQP